MNKSVKVHVGSMMIMAHIGLIPLLVCPPWKTFTEATKKGSQQNDSLISVGL
jgi:hypothetical protein